MRFKTVAVFDNYEVVEPTESVKQIEVIDIRRRSVIGVPVKHDKHKTNKDEYDRELTISAIVATIIIRLNIRLSINLNWIILWTNLIEITREKYSNCLLLDIPKKRLENFWRLIFIAGKNL